MGASLGYRRPISKWDGQAIPAAVVPDSFRRRLLVAWFDFTGWATGLMLATSFFFALSILAVVAYEHVYDYHSHAVLSGSMSPQLPVGSLVITRAVRGSSLQVGDIITFHPPGQNDVLITHRIATAFVELPAPAGSGQRYFFTKGDANPIRDSWRVPDTGTFEEAVNVIPYAGYVAVWMQARAARLILLLGPAVLLSIILLVEIWQPRRQRR